MTSVRIELVDTAAGERIVIEKDDNDHFKKLHPTLIANITSSPPSILEFRHPLLIQNASLQMTVGEKKSAILLAPTGQGKTLAYLLPLLHHLLTTSDHSDTFDPRALIFVPNRELAIQVYGIATHLLASSDIKVRYFIGGEKRRGEDLRTVRKDLVIACPGKLLDMMTAKEMSLASLDFMVMDECDRLARNEFASDIKIILTEFDMPSHKQIQTILCSATLSDEDYEKFVVSLILGTQHCVITVTEEPVADQEVIQAPPTLAQRYEVLKKILDEHSGEKVLVFVQAIKQCGILKDKLRKDGYDADEFHANLNQTERVQALNYFNEGKTQIVVATDIASRGLDIPNVDLVIQYSLPASPAEFDTYIHRNGRTNRNGKPGKCISFFVDLGKFSNANIARKLIAYLENVGQEVPGFLVQAAAAFASTPPPPLSPTRPNAEGKQKKQQQQQQQQQPQPQQHVQGGAKHGSTTSMAPRGRDHPGSNPPSPMRQDRNVEHRHRNTAVPTTFGHPQHPQQPPQGPPYYPYAMQRPMVYSPHGYPPIGRFSAMPPQALPNIMPQHQVPTMQPQMVASYYTMMPHMHPHMAHASGPRFDYAGNYHHPAMYPHQALPEADPQLQMHRRGPHLDRAQQQGPMSPAQYPQEPRPHYQLLDAHTFTAQYPMGFGVGVSQCPPEMPEGFISGANLPILYGKIHPDLPADLRLRSSGVANAIAKQNNHNDNQHNGV